MVLWSNYTKTELFSFGIKCLILAKSLLCTRKAWYLEVPSFGVDFDQQSMEKWSGLRAR